MTERRRLQNRRPSRFVDFESMNMKFTASVSHYDDGRIGEIFIDNHKQGSAVGTMARDSAIILSFALQHNADIDAIRRAISRDGPIGVALDSLLATGNGGKP